MTFTDNDNDNDYEYDISSVLADTPLRVRSAVLIVLMLLAILYTAYFAAPVVVPVVAAFLLNFLLSPLVNAAVSLRVPRVLAALLVMASLIAAISGTVYTLSEPAADWLRNAPTSIADLREKIGETPDALENMRQATEAVEEAMTDLTGESEAPEVQIREPRVLDTVMEQTPIVLAGLVLSIFLTFLLLISADTFLRKMTSLGRTFATRRRIVVIVRSLERQLAQYLGTVAMINTGLGVAVAGAMYLAGLPNPWLWGAVAAVLNFAPYLGPAATTVILFLAAVNVFDTLTSALLPPAAYLLITTVEGQVITPLLVGARLDVSPVVVFISVVIFGWMWGVVGALMAVPIVACVKICLINLPRTRAFGILLGK